MNTFCDKILRWLRYQKIKKYIPRNAILCDVGCGKNYYFLKKILDKLKYGIGFDKEVGESDNPKLRLRKLGIIRNLPLENESCDVITMMAVLEHLINPQEVLNECFRCLRKGGKLIMTTPTPIAKPILEFSAFKLKLIDQKEITDHKNYFWPKEIKAMLVKAGFQPEKIKNKFFECYFNNLIIAQK